MKIGVFGGTFDPPHLGHIRLAEAARRQLGLAQVLWVVTADPPHKQGQIITPVADRLALAAAALEGMPGHAVSRVDVDRPGPHWAADTVRLLGQEFPGAELVYLMGGDSLHDLPTWGRPRELLAGCSLGVIRRPDDAVDLAQLETILPGISHRVRFVDLAPADISAQDIRRRVQAGQPIDELVPAAIARLIRERRLYRRQ